MFDYDIRFNLFDNVSKTIRRINNNVAGLGQSASKTVKKIQSSFNKFNTAPFNQQIAMVEKKLGNLKNSSKELMGKGLTQAMGGLAVATAALQPLNIAKDYEMAFIDVKKSVNGTEAEMVTLRASAKQIAAETGKPFGEVAAAFAEIGKAGGKAGDIPAVADKLIKASLAMDADVGTTAERIMKIIGMTGQENNVPAAVAEIADQMTFMESKLSNVKFEGLSNVWKRLSKTFADFKFGNKEMAATAATMTKLGISEEVAASALTKLGVGLRKLDSAKGSQTNFMQQIQEGGIQGLLGVIKNLKKDKSMSELIKDLGIQGFNALEKLGSEVGSKTLVEAFGFSQKAKGAVQNEFDTYSQALEVKMKKAKAIFMNLMDSIGTPMLSMVHKIIGFLSPAVMWFVEFIQNHKTLFSVVAGGVAVVAGFVGILGLFKVALGGIGFALSGITPLLKIFLGGWALLKGVLIWFFGFAKVIFTFLKVQMLTNPFFWKWALIAGAIALVVWGLYKLFKWINSFIEWGKVIDWIKKNWVNLLSIIFPVFGFFRLLFNQLGVLYDWANKTKLWGDFSPIQSAISPHNLVLLAQS